MFHQGKKDNIQLSLVGDRTILAVIFDDKTTLGMVRLYVTEAVRKLEDLYADMARHRPSDAAVQTELDGLSQVKSSAKDTLDALFDGA